MAHNDEINFDCSVYISVRWSDSNVNTTLCFAYTLYFIHILWFSFHQHAFSKAWVMSVDPFVLFASLKSEDAYTGWPKGMSVK